MVAENTRKRIVFVIFIGAVIYGAVNFTGRRGGGLDSSTPTNAPLATAGAGGVTTDTAAGAGYDWTRDPFAFGGSTVSSASTETRVARFHLAAISEANGQLMAIINGKPVSRGETIDGWTVARLTKSTAVLVQGGKEMLLEMEN